MHWDPQQYNRFEQQRSAPFEDALKLFKAHSKSTIIDLGCGTGALTARLADLFPDSTILGIDSSADMLQQAQSLASDQLTFQQCPIEQVTGSWDVVFSHAAIQWLPNHTELLPKLWQLVRAGGQMVVQLPSNHEHISHTLMYKLAQQEPYQSALNGWFRHSPVLSLSTYAERLWQLQAQEITIFEKVYPHNFEHSDQIVEWVRGTALRPYLHRLPASLQDSFIATYRQQLHEHMPNSPVFYGFRRILWSAMKGQQ